MGIKFRRKIQPGGFCDNVALSAISASAFAMHPALHLGAMPGGVAAGLMAGSGGAWAAKRIMDEIFRPIFKGSNVKINSDEVPDCASSDGITLGYTADKGEPVNINWNDFMRHLFVIGQSGVGKTVFGEWLMFQQIIKGGGLLWIDGKLDPENLKKLDQMCTWAGRRDDLLVINPGDPAMSNTYNPILDGDVDEVASRILSLIPSSESNPGTDYYRQAANQGLTTLIGAIQKAGKAYNFMDLSILLQNQKALASLEMMVPDSTEKKALQLFLEQYKSANKDGLVTIDIKRMKETFGGVGGRMHMFGSGNFGMVTNTYTPEVNLYNAVLNSKIVYVALPTMGKADAASNFGKMVVGDFRSAIARVQELPKKDLPWPPFLNFSDEAGSYVTPAWARIFEQARSAHLAMMPAIQTIANLDAVSSEFREMVIGNTWTKIYFKPGTDETADHIAKLIGNEKKIQLSTSFSGGSGVQQDATGTARKGSSGSDSFGITEREEESEKVDSDVLKALDKGEAIVTYGGSKVYHIKVPAISFDASFNKEIGPFSLNRNRGSSRFFSGLDLFRDVNRWIAKNGA